MQYVYAQLSEHKLRARVVLMWSEKEQEELSWSQVSGSEQKAKHAAAEIGLMTLAVCSQLRTSQTREEGWDIRTLYRLVFLLCSGLSGTGKLALM